MRRSPALAATLALILVAPAVPAETSPPADRIQETHEGPQAGVVYSIHGEDPVTFGDEGQVCVDLDYGRTWHDASWSLVMWDGVVSVGVTVFLVDREADSREVAVAVDARGPGGPRQNVTVHDESAFGGGTGPWCLPFEKVPFVRFGTTVNVLVGAPDAEETNVTVDLRPGTTVDWSVATLDQAAGLWATDRHMRNASALPGVNARAGPAHASVAWGVSHEAPPGTEVFAAAGPMPFAAAAGHWTIDGPHHLEDGYTGLAAPVFQGQGLVAIHQGPSGPYGFSYDGVTAGFVGFFAHLIPYEAPAFPSEP